MEEKIIPSNPNLGLFLLRLTIGLLFVYGGVGKLFGVLGGPGIEMFSGMVWGMVWLAYLVAVVELVTGIMLLVGFFTRFASIALVIVMVAAILIAHNPFTMDGQLMAALIRLTIIGGLLNLVFSGPGNIGLGENS